MLKVAMLSKWHVHAEGYARELVKTGKAEITAVWDENPERGAEWASRLGCDFEADLDKLLARSDVDAVCCDTPTTMHTDVLIRAAKAEGVDVTCETAPHYLVLSDRDLLEEGRFKMNPPLRDESDRDALIEGILDGTIDMIATDHAPHSAEEKSRGLENSAFGIVGLETAFPVMYTEFVRTGRMTPERLVELMCINPRRRFGITSDAGFSVWDVSTPYTVDPAEVASMGRATPFEGRTVYGRNLMTAYNGKTVYTDI
jgi:dihydroorotase